MDKETKKLLETLCKGLPGIKIKASSFKKDVIFTVTGISSVNEDSNLFAVHCKDGNCEYVLPSNLCEVASDESIFPELKKRDCERIRKDIIWCIKHSDLKSDSRINYHVTTTMKEALTWLEKQREEIEIEK